MFHLLARCGLFLVLAALSVQRLRAGDAASDMLLSNIEKRVDIASPGAHPFQLEADFTVQVNTPQEGHVTWKWLSKEFSSQEITVGSYRQISVHKGEASYTSRNAPFTPLRVTDMQRLLPVFSEDCKCWQIKRAKHQADSQCFELQKAHTSSGEWNPKRTTCINPSTNELLTDEFKDDSSLRREEYADYQPFGNFSYPRQMKLLIDGSVAVKMNVVSLLEASFDESAFVPPPGATARRRCENVRHPIPVKTPDPDYPRSAAQNGMGGTVTVSLTVEADGSVSNVQLLGSAGHEMDGVSQQILKTWKFKPAMCGTEPIPYDLHVLVIFRLH
jgi:TonB family protein